MKIELTEKEAAILLATSNAIKNLRNQIQPVIQKIEQYNQKQLQIAEEIRERTGAPNTSLERWDLSEVDQVNFNGVVKIPETNGSDNDD